MTVCIFNSKTGEAEAAEFEASLVYIERSKLAWDPVVIKRT